ncbi:MAG TPA: hypothetical protein VFN48_07650 [Solirubrobacteraceae bacterium]|nr:hypothetical protein [Solirubrobacteraceae bacterium]
MNVIENLRAGRGQKLFCALTAGSALPMGVEIYINHYGGSFGNKWMWTPVALSPALTAASVGGIASAKVARTAVPALSAVFLLDGLAGVYFHLRGVQRKPGGFKAATYNLVMGPPAFAPGSLALIGAVGMIAAVLGREED